jgi:hypothetical protein
LGGAIAQGEEQLVVQIDVSETENRSHSGAQRFQLIKDERNGMRFRCDALFISKSQIAGQSEQAKPDKCDNLLPPPDHLR